MTTNNKKQYFHKTPIEQKMNIPPWFKRNGQISETPKTVKKKSENSKCIRILYLLSELGTISWYLFDRCKDKNDSPKRKDNYNYNKCIIVYYIPILHKVFK